MAWPSIRASRSGPLRPPWRRPPAASGRYGGVGLDYSRPSQRRYLPLEISRTLYPYPHPSHPDAPHRSIAASPWPSRGLRPESDRSRAMGITLPSGMHCASAASVASALPRRAKLADCAGPPWPHPSRTKRNLGLKCSLVFTPLRPDAIKPWRLPLLRRPPPAPPFMALAMPGNAARRRSR